MAGVERVKTPQAEEQADLMRLLDSGLVEIFGTAIDGGAHIGGWTRLLAGSFERVLAFEPAADTFTTLLANMHGLWNVELHQAALMARAGRVDMVLPPGRGAQTARYAIEQPAGGCAAIALDDLELSDCDFLKLDLEGAEVLALQGAERTIRIHRPFVLIEEFGHGHRYGHAEADADRLLVRWGYERVWEAGPNIGFRSIP